MQYMGSKNRFAKELVPIIQSYIDNNNITIYIEPFCGGANIIDKIKCKNRIGFDINKYLIALLSYIRDNDLNNLPNTILFEKYDKVRKSYKNNTDEYEDWYKGLVGFCGSFGSKFFGGYARASKDDITGKAVKTAINNLRKQKSSLENIKFQIKDYKDLYGKIKNAVVYLDPPYKNTTKYNAIDKNFNYEYFYDFCGKLKDDGNIVLVSEYSMPNDFKVIWQKEVKINLDRNKIKNDDKNKRIEKLFIL